MDKDKTLQEVEACIIEALGWAKDQNREIISIGIPLETQEVIASLYMRTGYGVQIKNIYGVNVVDSETLSITIKLKPVIK